MSFWSKVGFYWICYLIALYLATGTGLVYNNVNHEDYVSDPNGFYYENNEIYAPHYEVEDIGLFALGLMHFLVSFLLLFVFIKTGLTTGRYMQRNRELRLEIEILEVEKSRLEKKKNALRESLISHSIL